jgi:hypothetical protein
VQALGALFVPYTPPLKSTLPQMVLHRPVEPATHLHPDAPSDEPRVGQSATLERQIPDRAISANGRPELYVGSPSVRRHPR